MSEDSDRAASPPPPGQVVTKPQQNMLVVVFRNPGRSLSVLGAIAYGPCGSIPERLGSRYARQAARLVWNLQERGFVQALYDPPQYFVTSSGASAARLIVWA